jgi:nitroreductase
MDTILLKQAIDSSQHCQRNWDLTKKIDPAHIDIFIHAVTQCPSKQNHSYYSVKFITNRDIIEKIHNHTYSDKNTNCISGLGRTNPQVLANLLVLFEGHPEEYFLNKLKSSPIGEQYLEKDGHVKFNRLVLSSSFTSIGIASGYLNLIANQLGYKTGFCECFDPKEVATLLGTNNMPRLMLGIGYPDEEKPSYSYHQIDNYRIPPKIKETIEYSFIN